MKLSVIPPAIKRRCGASTGRREIDQLTQLLCELQRDWIRKETVRAFMSLFIETGGTAGIQFSYDREAA